MSDNLVIGGATFSGVTGIKATDTQDNTVTFLNGCDPDDYYEGIEPSGEVVLDRATALSAFRGAGRRLVTKISSDTVTKFSGDRIFNNCTALEEIVMTNVTSCAGQYLTSGCNALKRVYLPKLASVTKEYAFPCSGTTDCVFVFPALTKIPARLFRDCGTRMVADFGTSATAIGGNDVWYTGGGTTCVAIFRSPTLVAAPHTDTIKMLRTIYVPQALISSYQSATNWATRYNNNTLTINAIEGSVYEHNYADGTPIPTT
jgi:hypothetical protein